MVNEIYENEEIDLISSCSDKATRDEDEYEQTFCSQAQTTASIHSKSPDKIIINERSILNDYNIGRQLGCGAFSNVKLANNNLTHHKVAVKIVSTKLMTKSMV